jgi:hypothetical protein
MSKKPKIIGEQYGVIVTKPFSNEMYNHNTKVAGMMRIEIEKAIIKHEKSFEKLNDIARSVTGYTFSRGMMPDEISQELLLEVSRLANWWLAQEYPYLVKKGYCKDLGVGMVGFDSTNLKPVGGDDYDNFSDIV